MNAAIERMDLVSQKLAMIDAIEEDIIASMQWMAAMHGQVRFAQLDIGDAVHYLRATFLCECKDRLLGIHVTRTRYAGTAAITALRAWLDGKTASGIAFLARELDDHPFDEVTAELQSARQQGDDQLIRRLEHGRGILMNRAWNRLRLLEAIFLEPESLLLATIQAAAAAYELSQSQIDAALARFADPLYSQLRDPRLAWRNMALMRGAGLAVLISPADLPGSRTNRVQPPMRDGAFAMTPIHDYIELTAPWHNNPAGVRFANHLEVLAPEAPFIPPPSA